MRLCFVCPYAYPLFRPGAKGRFGGSEVRAWLFARALASQAGYQVSAAVFDQGQPAREMIDRVELVSIGRPGMPWETSGDFLREHVERRPGFPWLRVRQWSPGLAWQLPRAAARRLLAPLERELYLRRPVHPVRRKAFRRIDADVYCTFGAHHITAEVVHLARRQRRTSLLFLSSTNDLLPEYRPGSRLRNAYGEPGGLCYDGLANANVIVAQTAEQQAILRERFGRDATVIPNPVELPLEPVQAQQRTRQFALWVGKADDSKRPELCLELARRCSDVPFTLVMNRADPHRFEAIAAQRPANVRLIEQVAFPEMDDLFRSAAILVNTSGWEGMPNAFLEAGKFAVPVVSLEADPDGMLSRHAGGVAAGGDLEAMAAAVRLLWSDALRADELGRNLCNYVYSRHRLEDCAAQLSALLEGVR